MPGRSKYTQDPITVPRQPEPEQKAIEVPEEEWIRRSGWGQMAYRAIANGYRVRLTYSRGWLGPEGDLTHGLLLRIYVPGTLVPCASAWWWAKAAGDIDTLRPSAKYAFKGAMIAGKGHKISSTELTDWLTRPKEDHDQ